VAKSTEIVRNCRKPRQSSE